MHARLNSYIADVHVPQLVAVTERICVDGLDGVGDRDALVAARRDARQALAPPERSIPDGLDAMADLQAAQGRAVRERIVPDERDGPRDHDAGQGLAPRERVATDGSTSYHTCQVLQCEYYINHVECAYDDDDLIETILHVADGTLDDKDLLTWLKEHIV